MMANPEENTALTPLIDPLLSALATEELALLARTCKLFNSAFKQELNARKLNELVRRIVCGEEAAAMAILDVSPELLLKSSGEATDYSRRKIKNLAPFEAALAACDADMLKMMTPYFDRLDNGREIMQYQFKQIFPDQQGESRFFPDAEGGVTGHLKRQKENVFDFSAILAAFNSAGPDQVTTALNKEGARWTDAAREKDDDQLTLTEALNRFREQFTQKSHSEIVFNPQHLLRVFEVYVAQIYGRDLNKSVLFWRQVIGFVQRFLPACDAQFFAEGFDDPAKYNYELIRSFDFKPGCSSFYPLNFQNATSLGFDFAVAYDYGPVSGPDYALFSRTWLDTRLYQDLYRAKQGCFENLRMCGVNFGPVV